MPDPDPVPVWDWAAAAVRLGMRRWDRATPLRLQRRATDLPPLSSPTRAQSIGIEVSQNWVVNNMSATVSAARCTGSPCCCSCCCCCRCCFASTERRSLPLPPAQIYWPAEYGWLSGLLYRGKGLIVSTSPWGAAPFFVPTAAWVIAHTTHFARPGDWLLNGTGSGHIGDGKVREAAAAALV